MKQCLAGASICLLIGVLCAWIFFLPNGPRVGLPQLPLNLGKVALGATVPASVVLRNEGDRPLEVLLSGVSCSCITPNWKNRTIQPGEESALELSIKASPDAGVSENYLHLRTNDSSQVEVMVPLRLEAVPVALVKEGSFQFDRVDGSNLPQSREVVLTKGDLPDVAPADIVSVESPSEFFAIEIVEKNINGVRLKGTLKAEAALGTHAGMVELKFPLAYAHSVCIPFYAKIAGAFAVTPGSVFLSAYEGGTFTERCVVECTAGGLPQVSGITTTGEIAKSLTVTPAETNGGVELTIQYAPPVTGERKTRALDGKIVLTARSADPAVAQAVLHIPVRAACEHARQ